MGEHFQRALLEQLLTSEARVAERRRGRRRRWTAGVGAAVAAVAAVVGSLALTGSPAAADVRVTFEGPFVRVTLTDLDTKPREIVSALADAGFEASVRLDPVGPSNVGRFTSVVMSSGLDLDQGSRLVPDDGVSAFVFLRGTSGALEIGLGRAAEPGEVWVIPSDATAEGEVLHCVDVVGRRIRDVRRELRGIDVRAADPGAAPAAVVDAATDDRVISSVEATGSDAVILRVQPPGTPVDRRPPC